MSSNRREIGIALRRHLKLLVAVSATSLTSGIFGLYSILLTDYTAYAISIRRLEILFTIVLGWKVLGDTNIRIKALGGSLMTIGVIAIAVL